jgi:uncharacterized coiled-coil protein SlyX
MDPRLVELEIRYTHLEEQFRELSQVVFEQRGLIDLLRQQLSSLRARMGGLDEPPEHEKPPHY